MNTKEKILSMVQRLSDEVTYDQVIYHLEVMRLLEERIAEADQGEFIDHEEVFASLLEEDEKGQTRLDRRRQSRPATAPTAHRSKRTKDGSGVHPAPKGRRKQP